MVGWPNTRVQRTRSSASPPPSPLTRRPLGRRKFQKSFFAFVATAMLVLVGACAHSRDGLQRLELKLAGPRAVDCGGVRPGESPQVVDRCAVDAFRAGRPFIARYFKESVDSTVAMVLIGRQTGGASRVYYDSAPCGGPGCSESLVEKPCANPHEWARQRQACAARHSFYARLG